MRGWLWRASNEPAAVEKNLEPGAKIHRCWILGHADIPEITRAVAGGNILAAAQRNSEMGKVAANADALGMSVGGSAGRTGHDGNRIRYGYARSRKSPERAASRH